VNSFSFVIAVDIPAITPIIRPHRRSNALAQWLDVASFASRKNCLAGPSLALPATTRFSLFETSSWGQGINHEPFSGHRRQRYFRR
jgi:hypothetical protein